jgi:hypothetical protein
MHYASKIIDLKRRIYKNMTLSFSFLLKLSITIYYGPFLFRYNEQKPNRSD